MRYRKLSPTGDYVFGQGSLNFFINTPAGVAQAVKTSLLLWLGEWYLNIEDGVPYLVGIIGKHSQTSADAIIQQTILGVTVLDSLTLSPTQAVVSIDNYSSSINPLTRAYNVTATLNTIYGPTELQVQNYVNF